MLVVWQHLRGTQAVVTQKETIQAEHLDSTYLKYNYWIRILKTSKLNGHLQVINNIKEMTVSLYLTRI